MIKEIRRAYNEAFTSTSYEALLATLNQNLIKKIEFRVAETPVFIPAAFQDKLIKAGNDLVKTILASDFKQLTEKSIPATWRVAHENDHPHFLTFDFAVCRNQNQELVPKLIELQGFPSMYAFQAELATQYQNYFPVTRAFTPYFPPLDQVSYLELLRQTIIGSHAPHEVILLDINAEEQKTVVDFYLTAQHLGIAVVALHELEQQGTQFFYTRQGVAHPVKRIYNRLIFDEIANQAEAFAKVPDLLNSDQLEWVTHPNWFYRISKYTMPFLNSEFVPDTRFLSEVKNLPANLENYVLKPLFSFAGQGVIIDVTEADITAIKDPENWILQEKVIYEPVIAAPNGKVKCEIRLMYLWPEGEPAPILTISLARLSRGKMIGVRYNQDFDWVGGTVGMFA